jgi:hypothetical protein
MATTTATSNDVFLAVLAMDSYNRGYLTGLKALTGTGIGTATIVEDKVGDEEKAAAFYAVTYNWDSKTVISYRGTTFEVGENTAKDIWNGWRLGIGFADASQPQYAKAYYEARTGLSIYNQSAPSNVILTGHSLGGGLAGFISSLTGAKANVYEVIGDRHH